MKGKLVETRRSIIERCTEPGCGQILFTIEYAAKHRKVHGARTGKFDNRTYMREYNQRPDVKARKREYNWTEERIQNRTVRLRAELARLENGVTRTPVLVASPRTPPSRTRERYARLEDA